MNRIEQERMHAYTNKHVKDPQPGDHFTEMFGSVAYIEARNGDALIVKRTAIKKGEKCWGDDEPMTVAEFVRRASYGGGTPGYWLQLWPPQIPKQLLEGG